MTQENKKLLLNENVQLKWGVWPKTEVSREKKIWWQCLSQKSRFSPQNFGNVWIGRIFELVKFLSWPNFWVGQIFELAKFLSWSNLWVGQIFEFIKWELCSDHITSWHSQQGVSMRILLLGYWELYHPIIINVLSNYEFDKLKNLTTWKFDVLENSTNSKIWQIQKFDELKMTNSKICPTWRFNKLKNMTNLNIQQTQKFDKLKNLTN